MSPRHTFLAISLPGQVCASSVIVGKRRWITRQEANIRRSREELCARAGGELELRHKHMEEPHNYVLASQ